MADPRRYHSGGLVPQGAPVPRILDTGQLIPAELAAKMAAIAKPRCGCAPGVGFAEYPNGAVVRINLGPDPA